MPVSVEIYIPEENKWKYQSMVTPAGGHGTIEGYSGDEEVVYVVRCKEDDSTAIINKITPAVILKGGLLNAVLFEKGDSQLTAILRRGEIHTELIRPSQTEPAREVRFTQL